MYKNDLNALLYH